MRRLIYFLIGSAAMVMFGANAEVLPRIGVIVNQLTPPAGVYFEFNQPETTAMTQDGAVLEEQVIALKRRFPTLDIIVLLNQSAIASAQIKNYKTPLYQVLRRLSDQFGVAVQVDAKSAYHNELDERNFPSYVQLQENPSVVLVDLQRRRYERIQF